jgi:hypothetical protein
MLPALYDTSLLSAFAVLLQDTAIFWDHFDLLSTVLSGGLNLFWGMLSNLITEALSWKIRQPNDMGHWRTVT